MLPLQYKKSDQDCMRMKPIILLVALYTFQAILHVKQTGAQCFCGMVREIYVQYRNISTSPSSLSIPKFLDHSDGFISHFYLSPKTISYLIWVSTYSIQYVKTIKDSRQAYRKATGDNWLHTTWSDQRTRDYPGPELILYLGTNITSLGTINTDGWLFSKHSTVQNNDGRETFVKAVKNVIIRHDYFVTYCYPDFCNPVPSHLKSGQIYRKLNC